MALETTYQKKSIALQEFIRSDAFKKQYGDWEKGESSLVLDDDGEPLVLWHGSPNKFGAFDLSHAGENTGITEYTLKSTGEKTVSDSSKTIFFTDNRQLAASYAFLARTHVLSRRQGQLTDIGALLQSPEGTFLSHIHTLDDFKNTVRELRKENDAQLNAVLDKLPDLDGKNPISSMSEAEREALAKEFFDVRSNYAEMYRMNSNGGISNRLNNVLKMQEYLPYFRENFDRLCSNDTSVLTQYGEDFTKYDMSFYSGEESQGRSVHVFWQSEDKRMMASGFRQEPVYLDALTVSERKELLDKIDSDLAQCIKEYNRDIAKAGFEESTHLYPVFLKAAKPLVHDYQGSSFPDKYKPNEKYDTAYIAARQSAKAIKDGYDAVVYKNITDPFLGTTYGVFSTDNIVMIDRSLMREEELSPRLEVKEKEDIAEKLAESKGAVVNNANSEIQAQKKEPVVTFIEDDSPYYKVRTKRNADAADVTIAFAVDFATAGEKCTRNVAGDRYIAVNLPPRQYFSEPESDYAKRVLKQTASRLEAGINYFANKYGFSSTDVNVNIAGNGIYTLNKYGLSQADADRFVTDVFRLMENRPNIHVSAIRSGGQTGIDEAGIKAAAALGIPATVLAPQGWKFRGADGRDVSDEAAFKARFSSVKEARAEKVAERKDAAVSPELHIVSRGGKYNYVGGDGKALCSVWLDSAEPFRNGRARCVVGNTQFEIDTKGIILKKEALKNGLQKGI